VKYQLTEKERAEKVIQTGLLIKRFFKASEITWAKVEGETLTVYLDQKGVSNEDINSEYKT
jgi:hypothetical protein